MEVQTILNGLTIINSLILVGAAVVAFGTKKETESLKDFELLLEGTPNETKQSSASKEASKSQDDPKGTKTLKGTAAKAKKAPTAGKKASK